MSIASEIARLQGVKSDILQAISDKGVTVPAGSALDDCPGLIVSIGEGVIGGKRYKTVVMPDGKEWLAENLDFKFCNIGGTVSNPTSANAWYYNSDESTYGWNGYKCGLLYNWYAAKVLNDNRSELIPGWHVPTDDEWDSLFTSIGGTTADGKKLEAVNGSAGINFPNGWNGTDNYGFAVLPGGYVNNNTFNNVNFRGYYWTITKYDNAHAYSKFFTENGFAGDYDSLTTGLSLRLVRDT